MFLKEKTQNWFNAYFSPNIPETTESNARLNFPIPEYEKIEVIIDEAFLKQNTGKSGFVFTDNKIYIKPPFKETHSVSYDELYKTPYSFFREKIPENESAPEKDMASVCQKIKNIVMYTDPDHRKPIHDPDKSRHPVRDWFVSAFSFIFFIVLFPWLSWDLIGPMVPFPTLVKYLSLVSLLSWFIWFHSHRVTVKKKDRHSLYTLFKRIITGVFFSAGFVGAVALDRIRSNPDLSAGSLIQTLSVSFLLSAVCILVLFWMQKFFHRIRINAKIKSIAEKYIEKREKEGKEGLLGLSDAGVCDLDNDQDIRKVCHKIANVTINPLKGLSDLLENIDLMTFFEYAKDRGYDFTRWGKPEDIINELKGTNHGY
ncbi:hypothetical protein JXL83_06915 [candidate division WOR-3 bacterium]|nr:hypothetical protein [candidate division WOR-3 bacterium]